MRVKHVAEMRKVIFDRACENIHARKALNESLNKESKDDNGATRNTNRNERTKKEIEERMRKAWGQKNWGPNRRSRAKGVGKTVPETLVSFQNLAGMEGYLNQILTGLGKNATKRN